MQPTAAIDSPLQQAAEVEVPEAAINVKIFQTWAELEMLRSEWCEILHSGANASIFSTPEWLDAWWKSYGQGGQLVGVAVYAGVLLVGLAPLYAHSVRPLLGLPLRELRFVGDGSGDSDNLSFIIRPGYEELFVQSFVNWLVQQGSWDLCRLCTMPGESLAVHLLVRSVERLGWTHAISTQPWSAIILSGSWDKYLAGISAKERGKIRYYRRRLEKRYDTHFYRCTGLKELPRCLEQLFDLHQKRWNQRKKAGSFASMRRRAFYCRMTRSLLIRGWLELWFLDLDGRAVAAQCGLRYGDGVYSLQEGFDPDYAADSVGYVLRSHVLQCLIDEGIRRYDFLRGEDKNKQRWGTNHGKYVNIELARPGSRAVRYLTIHQKINLAKEWLRPHLAPGLLRVIQAAGQSIGVLEAADPTLHDLTL